MDTKNNVGTEILKSEIYVMDRKRISFSGIKKLISFEPEEFVMETSYGPLVLRGSQLEITKLDIASGDLNVKGKINSLFYLDGKDSKKDTSFLAKLFK